MLELRNIEKYYNPGTINEMCLFDKFNLTVDKGEFVSVVGSNGSGKTSMLNILCGSIPVKISQRRKNLRETRRLAVSIRIRQWEPVRQ